MNSGLVLKLALCPWDFDRLLRQPSDSEGDLTRFPSILTNGRCPWATTMEPGTAV